MKLRFFSLGLDHWSIKLITREQPDAHTINYVLWLDCIQYVRCYLKTVGDCMNLITLTKSEYELILSKFPEYCRDMLRLYTGEELFYAYKLCCFKSTKDENGDVKGSDIFYLAMKAKMIAYLNGMLNEYGKSVSPIHPNAWPKLGKKFKYEFNANYPSVEGLIQQYTTSINLQRIA
jgi:hypothetical protein